MPVKLGPDGKVIEEKTHKAASFEDEFRPDEKTDVGRPPTDQSSEAAGASEGGSPAPSGYEARTVLARSKRTGSQAHAADSPAPDAATRVYRPGAQKGRSPVLPDAVPSSAAWDRPTVPAEGRDPEQQATSASADPMADPPVGWLVVIRGPGQGRSVTIGNGMNPIGRDHAERICVDFGDAMISRHSHAVIAYDPKGKQFYIQHGGGKNLTYVDEAPVLVPTELHGFSKIVMGETVLLFVPLCGERFDWEDDEQ